MALVKHILAFGATRDNGNPTIPTSQLGKSMSGSQVKQSPGVLIRATAARRGQGGIVEG